MNKMIKRWLLLVVLLTTIKLLAYGEDVIEKTESLDLVSINFKNYYLSNNFYNSVELGWEDFQNVYGVSTLSLNDVLSKVDIDSNINTEIKNPTNYVNDYAELIIDNNDEDSLNAKISRYGKSSGMEIAIVTINTLGDSYIEKITQNIFNTWGVGKDGSDNGILIVVAENEHEWRIQTGYGAEIVLPDILCSRFGNDILTPAFKNGDYYGGLDGLVDAIINEVGSDSKDIEAFKKKHIEEKERKQAEAKEMFISVVIISLILGLIVFIIIQITSYYNKKKKMLVDYDILNIKRECIISNFKNETKNYSNLKYIKDIIDDFDYFLNNLPAYDAKPKINEKLINTLSGYNYTLSGFTSKVQKYKNVYSDAIVSEKQLEVALEYNNKIDDLQNDLSKYNLDNIKRISNIEIESMVSYVKKNIDNQKLFQLYTTLTNSISIIKSQYKKLSDIKDSIPQMEKDINEYKEYMDDCIKQLNKYGLSSAITKLNSMVLEFEKLLLLGDFELFKKHQYLVSIKEFVKKKIKDEEDSRKRIEEAEKRRKRDSYYSSSSSYGSSSSSFGGGSSFGGFSGGRSGGGGASGGW